MKKISIFLLVFFISVLSPGQQIKLKFLQTTDVHGCVFPYDFIAQKETNHSLAQVMSVVRHERKIPDQKIILMDNGDFLQGQPSAYYYNVEDTLSTHLFAKAFNYMQYDVATVGNHDIEAGHTVYDKIRNEFNFSWLAANAVDKKTGKPYWKPYEIIRYQGITIAILGLTTPGIPKWLPEKLWEGIAFADMVETATFWMEEIQKKENPDIIIGLFHAGLDYTYGGSNAATPRNENASLLVAKNVPGFDIVFAGHDHKKYNDFVENNAGKKVLVLNGASHARYVAAAEVIIQKNKGEIKKALTGQLIDVAAFEADDGFMQTFQSQYNTIHEYVNQPVAKFTSAVDSKEAYFGSSAFIDLIHQVQHDLTGAPISIAAPLTYRTKIDSGQLLVSDMFKLYKFENLLYTINLTGKEIDDYLEYSYGKWINTMQDSTDFLFQYQFDSNNNPKRFMSPYYDFDAASGINYTVDLQKPVGEKVTIISVENGTTFYPDSLYQVAINSYRGNGGGGHLTKGAGLTETGLKDRLVKSTGKDLRFYMMQWLKQKETWQPASKNNWKLVPENWVKYRRPIEEQILFAY